MIGSPRNERELDQATWNLHRLFQAARAGGKGMNDDFETIEQQVARLQQELREAKVGRDELRAACEDAEAAVKVLVRSAMSDEHCRLCESRFRNRHRSGCPVSDPHVKAIVEQEVKKDE